MTTIYLIRHGEVENPNGIFYSRLPRFGLSERGKQQAAQTGEFLKLKHIDFLYSSPLLRARQTAAIIQKKLGLPKVSFTKQLLEVRSSFQGAKFDELGHDQKDVYFSPKRAATDENFEQIAQRGQTVVDTLVKKHPGKHLAAVSHGDVLMMLRSVISGLSAEYNSIRAESGFSYITHAEVFELIIDDSGKKTIKSIFIPK